MMASYLSAARLKLKESVDLSSYTHRLRKVIHSKMMVSETSV